MTDIRKIVGYIKSLKKGFDKDLFQSYINDLCYIVDSYNLCYNDFHTLFKLWLNLNIRKYRKLVYYSHIKNIL